MHLLWYNNSVIDFCARPRGHPWAYARNAHVVIFVCKCWSAGFLVLRDKSVLSALFYIDKKADRQKGEEMAQTGANSWVSLYDELNTFANVVLMCCLVFAGWHRIEIANYRSIRDTKNLGASKTRHSGANKRWPPMTERKNPAKRAWHQRGIT